MMNFKALSQTKHTRRLQWQNTKSHHISMSLGNVKTIQEESLLKLASSAPEPSVRDVTQREGALLEVCVESLP